MQILSYGYELPETGDFGDVWFVSIEDNIKRLNSHSHNGTDSAKITSSSVTSTHQTVLSGTFSVVGGRYRSTVSMAAGLSFDDYLIICKDPSSGDQVFLSIEKIDANSFYLYTGIQQDYEVYFIS